MKEMGRSAGRGRKRERGREGDMETTGGGRNGKQERKSDRRERIDSDSEEGVLEGGKEDEREESAKDVEMV